MEGLERTLGANDRPCFAANLRKPLLTGPPASAPGGPCNKSGACKPNCRERVPCTTLAKHGEKKTVEPAPSPALLKDWHISCEYVEAGQERDKCKDDSSNSKNPWHGGRAL